MTIRQRTKQTYKTLILNHMLEGKTISTMQAYSQYDMTCFLQRVSEMRLSGMPIQDKAVKRNGKRYNVYWLNRDYIQTYKAYEVTQ